MRHTPEGKPKLSPLVPSSSVDRSAAVTALLGPSRSAASRAASMSTFRPRDTAPLVDMSLSSQDKPTPPASAPALPTRPQNRSVSQPLLSSIPAGAQGQSAFGSSLTSSRPQTIDATLPLQVLPPASAPPPPSYLSAANPFHNLQTGSAPLPQSSFGQTTGVSPGLGVSSTGMSSSFSGTNLSPFQASPFGAAPLSSTPSPHPFSPQGLSIGPNGINTQSTTTNQSQIAFSQPFGQSQTPFGQPNQASFGQPSQFLFTQTIQTPFNQPVSIGQQFGQQHAQAQSYTQQQQMQMQFAQPQPQLHTSAPGNPYLQTPSPFMGAQSVGGSPSPLAQTQALPQTNTTQTGFGGANPFTSWIQQPPAQQQGGYSRQWGM
ncbi:uncharacterized protein PHACADRAFT_254002 [Phanerochaete carnosa HHB-10118-sp]|uniref:Uncharacterized protein n=1 Tax=Phanerochaete carnosa (strain HHB-10118-sp) TaxID=650164 RepID=K5VYQ5_PHACS|nr:uncharacterized protein PHACADRAFT_254002 [Phanerochaete carnosa HHB-10118-sp]EKM56718.1 hypothetical protein PHACADRAFT_254002 [Phanerochaete carnosa HHB-10118-sp]